MAQRHGSDLFLKHRQSPELLLCFSGLFFIIAFEILLTLDVYRGGYSDMLFNGSVTRYVASIVTFLAVAITSSKLLSLVDHPLLVRSAVILCILGGVLLLTYKTMPFSEALLLLGSVAVGCGISLFKLHWLEFYAHLSITSVVLYYTLAHICSSLTIAMLSLIEPRWFVMGVYSLFPLAAFLCYRRSLNKFTAINHPVGEKVLSQWSFPVKPVILVGLFTFTNTLVRSYLPVETRGYIAIGVTLVGMLVFVSAYLRPEEFDFRILYKISFPLMIIGPLCLLIGGRIPGIIGALGVNAAFTCLLIFVTVVLCALSFRYGANPLWLFGFAFGAVDVGKLIAQLSESIIIPQVPHVLVFCSIIFLLSVMFTLLLTDKGFEETWGIVEKTDDATIPMALDNMVNRCARLSRLNGLTRREEEILFLLSQNRTPASIAGQFYLAESTVKTHVKHIYTKFGVHNKAQLMEVIGKS
jgi:DNA-binding CsgD family transcriptional regulator